MSSAIVTKDYFLKPGYIFLTAQPTKICTILGTGVALALFDTKNKIGGMSQFILPQIKGEPRSIFAEPSIMGLLKMFHQIGSKKIDLEAHLFGGATRQNDEMKMKTLGENNAKQALKILKKMNVKLSGSDLGGHRGRKIVFNNTTGEIIIAKVDNIRLEDWYPALKFTDKI